MVDYTRLTATAQRLISANGRSITLVQFDSTPSDASRPWLGPADPRATPDASLTVDAVFVDNGSGLGKTFNIEDLLKKSDQVALLSAGAQVDLSIYNEVIDGTERYKITGFDVLRPAGVTVLAVIGMKR